jgi:hypothetical protein
VGDGHESRHDQAIVDRATKANPITNVSFALPLRAGARGDSGEKKHDEENAKANSGLMKMVVWHDAHRSPILGTSWPRRNQVAV